MKHYRYIWIILVAIAFAACKKDEPAPIASVEIDDVTIKTSYREAEISWSVASNATVSEVVAEYALDSTFSKYEQAKMSLVNPKSDDHLYSVSLKSLAEGTQYFLRCRALNKINSHTSAPRAFKTMAYHKPEVKTDTVDNITVSTAVLHATLVDWGSDSIPQVGFCVATHANVSIDDSCYVYSHSTIDDTVAYTITLNNLTDDVTYYVRAYAKNNKGVSYGEEIQFTTTAHKLPIVLTSNVTDISYTTATCGGNVTSEGDLIVSERGICYATVHNPTTEDNKVVSGNGIGSFVCSLINLTNSTTYYVRAYAINAKGTAYGEELVFKTLTPAIIYYTSDSKLSETTSTLSKGIHINAFGSTSITLHTFNEGIGTIVFDTQLTSIGDWAFYGCESLTSIEIPNSVINIGGEAFQDCRGLTSLSIPNSVTSIGEWAFSRTGLTSITIPNSVSSIGVAIFDACKDLKSIVVESDNPIYDSRNNCNAIIKTSTNSLICACLNTIIPNSITSIDDYAFSGTSIISLNIPNSVTSIGNFAFYKCIGLTSLTIPNSVASVGVSAFRDCSYIISVSMGNNVTSIGDFAFCNCISLASISLPNSVINIGAGAFNTCTGLSYIVCEATTPPHCGLGVFYLVPRTTPVYVPDASISAYQAASGWSDFTNIQPINE